VERDERDTIIPELVDKVLQACDGYQRIDALSALLTSLASMVALIEEEDTRTDLINQFPSMLHDTVQLMREETSVGQVLN
jgi:hypothetical protein